MKLLRLKFLVVLVLATSANVLGASELAKLAAKNRHEQNMRKAAVARMKEMSEPVGDDLDLAGALAGAYQTAPVGEPTATPIFSLTELSNDLLKKPEFVHINDIDWLKQQARTDDFEKKPNTPKEYPNIAKRVALSALRNVFSVELHKKLLDDFFDRVLREYENAETWVNNGILPPQIAHNFDYNTFTMHNPKDCKPFIEKVFVRPDETLLCMGDLHGSLHSFLRNLWHMVECGQLKDDFTLAPNHRLIFLGDLVDRGMYGVEVIALLLILKLRNWDSVHIARGNHEDVTKYNYFLAERYGFFDEVATKYPGNPELAKNYKEFFLCLPHSLFIGVGDEASRWWMQCAHGAVDPFVSISNFLGKAPDAVINKSKRFAWVESLEKNKVAKPAEWRHGEGFNWSDVTGIAANSTYQPDTNTWRYTSRNAGICASIQDVNNYLHQNGLACIIRGHQDADYSFKVLINTYDLPQTWRLHSVLETYNPDRLFKQGFRPAEVFPVDGALSTPCFTCTTAGEGRANLNEGYIIIRCAPSYEEIVVQCYENHLSLPPVSDDVSDKFVTPSGQSLDALFPGRFGKFVTLSPRYGVYDDPFVLGVDAARMSMHRWNDAADVNPIHSDLVAIAKTPFPSKTPVFSPATERSSAEGAAGTPDATPISLFPVGSPSPTKLSRGPSDVAAAGISSTAGGGSASSARPSIELPVSEFEDFGDDQ